MVNRLNKLAIQLMAMVCWDLLFFEEDWQGYLAPMQSKYA